MENQLKL